MESTDTTQQIRRRAADALDTFLATLKSDRAVSRSAPSWELRMEFLAATRNLRAFSEPVSSATLATLERTAVAVVPARGRSTRGHLESLAHLADPLQRAVARFRGPTDHGRRDEGAARGR